MPIIVVFAAIAVAASIPLLILAATSEGSGLFARRAGRGEAAFPVDDVMLVGSRGERVVAPALIKAFRAVSKLAPSGIATSLAARLRYAGLDIPAEPLLFVKLLVGAGAAFGVSQLTSILPLIVLSGLIGFFILDAAVGGLAKQRQERILESLPQVLDQIRMSVEAGVGFEQALTRAARAGTGPLHDELRRSLREMQLGASRTEALRSLASRNDLFDLRAFANAVIQSEEYGVPVAHVLKVQASEVRIRRRQHAEEEAKKIPVKIVFPLVLCIFPALLVVLLGPAGLRIRETLL